MFGKVFSSQRPSANKRLFGTALAVDSPSVFHPRSHFPRDLRNGMSFSQNSTPFTSLDRAAVPSLLQSMARDKADGRRGHLGLKIDLAFGQLRSQEEE